VDYALLNNKKERGAKADSISPINILFFLHLLADWPFLSSFQPLNILVWSQMAAGVSCIDHAALAKVLDTRASVERMSLSGVENSIAL